MTINIFDASRCPEPLWCEGCESDGIAPVVSMCSIETTIGVLCVGLCSDCVETETVPNIDYGEIVRRVLDHGVHVGLGDLTGRNLDEENPWGSDPPWF